MIPETNVKYMSPKAVAEMTDISIHTLEKWRRTGVTGLPYFKVRQAVRYKESDVIEFMEAKPRCAGEA